MEKCKVPCNECPFRKNSLPGYLGGVYENGKELHDIVVTLESPFACHKVQGDNNVSWEDVGTKDFPVCAGSLLYMKKAAKMPRNPILAKLVKEVDYKDTVNILSVPEMVEHHKNSIGIGYGSDLVTNVYRDTEKFSIKVKDYSIGSRSSEEVEHFINQLKKERKEVDEYGFFGDNNWLKIDTQLNILEGHITEQYELDGLDLDEMSETECLQVLWWIDGDEIDFGLED